MNFNNLYKTIMEAKTNTLNIRYATQDELDSLSAEYDKDLKLLKGWVLEKFTGSSDEDMLVVRCKDLFEDMDNDNLMMYTLPNLNFEGYIYPKEAYYKEIMSWELKHKLSPNTVQTFGDLIDEL